MEFNNKHILTDSLDQVAINDNYPQLNNDFPASLDRPFQNSLAFQHAFDNSLGYIDNSLNMNSRLRPRNSTKRIQQNVYERPVPPSFSKEIINITIEYENPETKTLFKNKKLTRDYEGNILL